MPHKRILSTHAGPLPRCAITRSRVLKSVMHLHIGPNANCRASVRRPCVLNWCARGPFMPRHSLPQAEHSRRSIAGATTPDTGNALMERMDAAAACLIRIEQVCRERKRPNHCSRRLKGSRNCRCLHTCSAKSWCSFCEEQKSKECPLHINSVASRRHENFTIKDVFLGSKTVRVGGVSQDTRASSVDQLLLRSAGRVQVRAFRKSLVSARVAHSLSLSFVGTSYCDKTGLFKAPLLAFMDFSLAWISLSGEPKMFVCIYDMRGESP